MGPSSYALREMSELISIDLYEVRPRHDKRGFDLTSDVLPFGGLWYGEPNAISNAIGGLSVFFRNEPNTKSLS